MNTLEQISNKTVRMKKVYSWEVIAKQYSPYLKKF